MATPEDIRFPHSFFTTLEWGAVRELVHDHACECLVFTAWMKIQAWACLHFNNGLLPVGERRLEREADWRGTEGELYRILKEAKLIKQWNGVIELAGWQKKQGWVFGSADRAEQARLAALARHGKKDTTQDTTFDTTTHTMPDTTHEDPGAYGHAQFNFEQPKTNAPNQAVAVSETVSKTQAVAVPAKGVASIAEILKGVAPAAAAFRASEPRASASAAPDRWSRLHAAVKQILRTEYSTNQVLGAWRRKHLFDGFPGDGTVLDFLGKCIESTEKEGLTNPEGWIVAGVEKPGFRATERAGKVWRANT